MSNILAEYKEQQEKANKLKQAAIDEAVTKLVTSIEDTFKAIEQVKEIAPAFEFTKLSKFRKLSATFGITESAGETKAGKGKGRGKGKKSKSGYKLSDEKAKEILDFIGSEVKSTKEIAKHLGTKNPSNAISALSNQGKIVVAKREKLKKFWKKA